MPPKPEPRPLEYDSTLCADLATFCKYIPKMCYSIIDTIYDGKSVTATNKQYIEKNAREILKATNSMTAILGSPDTKKALEYFKAVFTNTKIDPHHPPNEASTSVPIFDAESIKNDIITSIQSVMEKHIQTINDNTEKQNKIINEIQKQQSRLTSTPTDAQQPRTTYSAVAATPARTHNRRAVPYQPKPPTSVPKTRPAIIVTPKSDDKIHNSEDAVKLFKQSISFRNTGYAPARLQAISKNKLRVEFERAEERDDTLKKLQGAPEVRAEPARHLKPMVMLKGITIDTPPEQLTNIILEQNPAIATLVANGAQFRYRLRKDNRNPKYYNAAFIADPAVWRWITGAGRICVDYQRVHAENFSPFMQCYRCLQFGHTRAKCEATTTPCAHCAKSDHSTDKCPSLEGPATCYNCTLYNTRYNNKADTSHRATAAGCPRVRLMKDRIHSRVDYGVPQGT
ncbi:uncharacterized protein LOC119193812 [Manduca sexta]|uniref:uncharacterized protein LOC119193812 n=1 Tax=Manduca sexta TaxID=7130 RepID=UPI00188F0F7B|nr:uncharacterized protein LOC119193812 [Manduca sexta]